MNAIRIAVVGLGTRSLGWIRLMQKLQGFEIVSICDPIEALHARAVAEVRDGRRIRRYTRYEEVLRDADVDAVALTVRCKHQGAMAAAALEAGKHCHQEVPAAHTLDDCRRLVEAQRRSGKVYLCAEQCRYAGFVRDWRDLVAAGRLGTVTYAEGQYLHYYVGSCFQNRTTGEFCPPDESHARPDVQPTWLWHMPPIHYVVHDLSPLLHILDDRVVQVVGMSTPSPGAAHPQLQWPDIQVALMKTAKGAVLRLLVSFAQPHPEDEHHWLQVIGTRGAVEWKRSSTDKPRLWLADQSMPAKVEMDWTLRRRDEPAEAHGTGHGHLDYYVHAAFRDAVIHARALEFDVTEAVNVAAAGILAAESAANSSKLLEVPDLR